MTEDIEPERASCLIQDVLGRVEACPAEACPFWEPGGAALPGGCALDRLALPTALDLRTRPDLALWLLEMRHAMEPEGGTDGRHGPSS